MSLQLGLPVILCARTALGTINHALLSLEAMARRSIRLHGIAFTGEPSEEVESAILAFGGGRRLGRLPPLDPLNASTLAEAFRANFSLADFACEPVRRSPLPGKRPGKGRNEKQI